MKVLLAPTEDFIKYGRALVAADALLGSSVYVTITNATEYIVGDYVVIGWEGSDTAELVPIVAITGNTIEIAILLFNHSKDEPVVKYRYNQRRFYGSLTSGGSYVELTSSGSPKNITVNSPQGTMLEYVGNEGYLYFKSTYYNSNLSQESNISDAGSVLGDESLRYCSLYDIRNQAGLTKNSFIDDGVVENYRKQAENEIDGFLGALYILPFMNSQGQNEIPFMVTRIAILLAAGYWDFKEFGSDGEGKKWLGEGRGILNSLQQGGSQRLIGADKKPMLQQTASSGVQSFPNTVDNNNGPTRQFTMQQRF